MNSSNDNDVFYFEIPTQSAEMFERFQRKQINERLIDETKRRKSDFTNRKSSFDMIYQFECDLIKNTTRRRRKYLCQSMKKIWLFRIVGKLRRPTRKSMKNSLNHEFIFRHESKCLIMFSICSFLLTNVFLVESRSSSLFWMRTISTLRRRWQRKTHFRKWIFVLKHQKNSTIIRRCVVQFRLKFSFELFSKWEKRNFFSLCQIHSNFHRQSTFLKRFLF